MLLRRHHTARSAAAPVAGPRVRTAAAEGSQAVPVWMLGLALCFLSVSVAGVTRPVVDIPAAGRAAQVEPPQEVAVQDLSTAALQSQEDDSREEADEAPAVEAAEPDTPPEPLLTEADVYEVPPAPAIVPALTLLQPAPEKPAAAPRPTPPPPRPPAPSRAAPQPRTAPAPAPAASSGGGTPGGSGRPPGTARSGSGGGKGKFPKPPYPSFAKKQGLTGTVTLSIGVAPDGSATSVRVTGSSGSSQLDAHAASWVQSRWRWPAGAARSFRVPVSFKLR
jgi:protein TonB